MSTVSVIMFWVIAAVLIAAALALLVPPLLGRGRPKPGPASADLNAAVYRARLEELEQEVRDGTLDADDFEQAKTELEREILENVDPGQDTGDGPGPSKRVALVVAALLPLLTLGIYLKLGEPDAIGFKRGANGGSEIEMAAEELDRAALERMAASFAERLAENPEEGEGWLVLGRAYVMLDQYERAVGAFARANAVLGDTPDVLVDYAEAEAMANENRFSQQARARIEKALRLAPRHEKGLWLGAFAAAQYGDIEAAVNYWRLLLKSESDSERRQLIEGLIARVSGGPAPAVIAPKSPDTPGVKVRVSLDETLRRTLEGTETVFVFARDASGQGPPLAVHRTTVADLPLTVILDDSMSMVPSLKVSEKDRVVITARVSISGDARAASGDFQGSSGAVAVGGDAPVEIIISERVP